MGKAEVIEKTGKAKKWHDVILRRVTGCNEPTEKVIAKFTAKGDAFAWAQGIADNFSYDWKLIID